MNLQHSPMQVRSEINLTEFNGMELHHVTQQPRPELLCIL